tara:strand:- start:2747 stop:3364 length:618 start_codon:yes stop_codon:yes gene_type:complete
MFTKQEILDRIAEKRAKGELLEAGYNLACFIATASMIDIKDKSGHDYAHHFLRVSRYSTDSEAKMIMGVLHDVVEDTDWTLDDLRTLGFSERIIKGIEGVTHQDGELYFDSIERCSLNGDSTDVKLKDNFDNMSQARNTFLPQDKDLERLKKYTITRNYLVDVKTDFIKAGTPVHEWMALKGPEMQDFEIVKKYSTKYRTHLGIS